MDIRIQTAKAFESNPSSAPLVVASLSSFKRKRKEEDHEKTRDGLIPYFDEGLLVRRTMKAVRRLHKEGRISLTMKRKLLFSIMKAAANDDIAQVVSAYEMLVEDEILYGRKKNQKGTIKPPSYDEFIDQCHIICESIPLSTPEDNISDSKHNSQDLDDVSATKKNISAEKKTPFSLSSAELSLRNRKDGKENE